MTLPKIAGTRARVVDSQLKMMVATLVQARLARDLTQREVADAVGIHQGTLSFIEQGRSDPTVRVLFALADLYDMPITLWRGDDEPA